MDQQKETEQKEQKQQPSAEEWQQAFNGESKEPDDEEQNWLNAFK